MRHTYAYAIAVAITLSLAACGSKNTDSSATTEVTDIDVTEFTNGHASEHSAEIDSLALNADELTADEGARVLIGYYEMAKESSEAGRQKTTMETMRKFVDVYDIVLGNHGNDFRNAIAKLRSIVDLAATATEYRERLADYDSGAGVESLSDERQQVAEADSTATAEGKASASSEEQKEDNTNAEASVDLD